MSESTDAQALDLPAPPRPRLSFQAKFLHKAKAIGEAKGLRDQVEIREREDEKEGRAGLFTRLRAEARKDTGEAAAYHPTDLQLSQESEFLPTAALADPELVQLPASPLPQPLPKPHRHRSRRPPKEIAKLLEISAAEGDSEDESVSRHLSDYSADEESGESDVSGLVDDTCEADNPQSSSRFYIEQSLRAEIGTKRPQFDRLITEDRSLVKRLKKGMGKVNISGSPNFEIRERDSVPTLEASPGEDAALARFRADKERWRLTSSATVHESLLDSASHQVLASMHVPQACPVPRSLLRSGCK